MIYPLYFFICALAAVNGYFTPQVQPARVPGLRVRRLRATAAPDADVTGRPDARDLFHMRLAMRHAQLAFRDKEVPIGAVIVEDVSGRVLATSRNRVEASQDPTTHAEMNCIRAATEILENWRLGGCTLYTTLEPCPMCMGTAMAARVSRVVYGASDPRLGAAGGGFLNMPAMEHPFHSIAVQGGVLERESQLLLTRFFRERRREKKRGARATTTGGGGVAIGADAADDKADDFESDSRGYHED